MGILATAQILNLLLKGKKAKKTSGKVSTFLQLIQTKKQLKAPKFKQRKVRINKDQYKQLVKKTKITNKKQSFKTKILRGLASYALREKKVASIVQAWSKEKKVSIKVAKKRYDQAAKIASLKFKPESKEWWSYKIGIFKKMMNKD